MPGLRTGTDPLALVIPRRPFDATALAISIVFWLFLAGLGVGLVLLFRALV